MIDQLTRPAQKKGVSSFIGLKAYSEEQASIFFGRDDEIKTLYKLIKANTLTILFGKSGTGKTSLLNAGVFPKLREDYCLPFRIRLEFLDDSPDLLAQIKKVLRSEIDKYGFKVEAYPGEETLWEYFHKEQLWKIVTPILIFDQFEEIFTLAKKSNRFKHQELEVLLEELSDLIENSIPEKLKDHFINHDEEIPFNYQKQKAKIIFSFREDFLPEMESITAKIPSVKNSRFRLMPMNGHQAYDVITKTWKNIIDSAEANKIVYFLTNETETESQAAEIKYGKYGQIEVEPSLLSQVCSFIDRERISEGRDRISAEFLKKYPKGIILRSLYNQALEEGMTALNSPANAGEKKPVNPVKEFIEDNLITDEGYRTKFALNEIDEKIRPGIEIIKRKYFIREEGDSIELTHDVIVTLVKSDREERRKQLALEAERKKAKRKVRLVVVIAILALISIWGFGTYRAWLKKRDLESEQVRLTEQNNTLAAEIESKKSLIDSARNLPRPVTSPVPKDPSLLELLSRISSDSLRMLSLSHNNLELSNSVNDAVNRLKTYKDSINSLAQHTDDPRNNKGDYKNLETLLKENKEYARMYQSHVDAFIDSYKNPDSLSYHINVLKQNRDGFRKKFNLSD